MALSRAKANRPPKIDTDAIQPTLPPTEHERMSADIAAMLYAKPIYQLQPQARKSCENMATNLLSLGWFRKADGEQ